MTGRRTIFIRFIVYNQGRPENHDGYLGHDPTLEILDATVVAADSSRLKTHMNTNWMT